MVLHSSEPNGICYIQTSNIDGESDLKLRKAPRALEESMKGIAAGGGEEAVADAAGDILQSAGQPHLQVRRQVGKRATDQSDCEWEPKKSV